MPQKSRSLKNKTSNLINIKYCRRLVTCSFDQAFLQKPAGFLAEVSSRLDLSSSHDHALPDWVVVRHPLIQPLNPFQCDWNGPVPLPMSISWTRYTPYDSEDSDLVNFTASEETDVLVVVLQDQLSQWLANMNSNSFNEFASSISRLNRPVSVILFRKPSQVTSALYDLMTTLQVDFGVKGVQHVATVKHLAILIANYTKAIAQRPFKQGRISATNGLSFVPTTVRRTGMSNAFPRQDLVCAMATSEMESIRLWTDAVGAWVRRTWLAQLGQWRGVTGEIANAIAAIYPTPRAMHDAIWSYGKSGIGEDRSDDLQGLQDRATARLSELPIRRGVGVLTTQNRLGAQIARRIVIFFTSQNPLDEGAS